MAGRGAGGGCAARAGTLTPRASLIEPMRGRAPPTPADAGCGASARAVISLEVQVFSEVWEAPIGSVAAEGRVLQASTHEARSNSLIYTSFPLSLSPPRALRCAACASPRGCQPCARRGPRRCWRCWRRRPRARRARAPQSSAARCVGRASLSPRRAALTVPINRAVLAKPTTAGPLALAPMVLSLARGRGGARRGAPLRRRPPSAAARPLLAGFRLLTLGLGSHGSATHCPRVRPRTARCWLRTPTTARLAPTGGW